MLAACELVVQLLGLSDAEFVTRVYTNVVAVPPSDADRNAYVTLLPSGGGSLTQAALLEIAASVPLTEQTINLVGLQATGVEFV